MSDHHIRVLRDDEHRAAQELFRATLHVKPADDGEWSRVAGTYQPGRTLGAFADGPGELIGTARSLDSELTVPGGKPVPSAAVTGVGVRADRTRRGVLTDLMRTQFADFAERGVVAATLHASEAVIYGRFGYGVGTLARGCTVDRRRARLRPEVPPGGEVRLIGADAASFDVLPAVYAALTARPGMMARPSYWWTWSRAVHARGDEPTTIAVHRGPEGIDGFVAYTVTRPESGPAVLRVDDLHAGTPDAFAGLWRFLLSVDLTDEIRLAERPTDEPVELLFTDPRVCRVTELGDETWLRLIDVPTALAAREYDGEPLVIEVTDPVLPANSGRYLVGPDAVRRTDAAPAFRLGADALSMVYLGAWRPSQLVQTGRAHAAGPDAIVAADRLFATRTPAWCGTFF